MRLIILVLLAFALAFAVLQINAIDPHNYVKLYLLGYSIESSVLGFALLLIAAVLVLYFLIWLFRLIWRSPRAMSTWQGKRNREKAQTQLGTGYLSLIKGDWRKAEQQLTAKSDHSAVPYVNYLAAAQAAQEQGKLEQRDQYLKSAFEAAPKERLAIGLTKARLHQQAGQMDLALATLQDIAPQGSKNPQYTAMLLQTYEQAKNWQQAQALLPVAKRQKALPDNVLENIRSQIYQSTLRDSDDIASAWRSLPRDQKKQVENVRIYAQALADQGDNSAAEKLIRSTLKHSWSDELVSIYGMLSSDKPARELRRVEGWLLGRPENAALNLAAGRFAVAAKKTEAAKEYLQAAITLGQLPAAYTLLGEVFESTNESGKALQLYRSGMAAISSRPSIALPETGSESSITDMAE